MKILDFIKNLISRNKTPLLNEANIDMDRTARIIKIDAIEEIIHDPETFKNFMNYENHRVEFGYNIDKIDYVLAINDYVEFMNNNGSGFNKTENKRINKILKPYKFTNKETAKNIELYAGSKREDLYNEAIKILKNEEEFKKYIENRSETYINKPILERYISNEFENLYQRIEFPVEEIKRFYYIQDRANTYENSTRRDLDYRDLSSYRIRPDFERAVMQDIPKGLSGTELAFQIYNELNKRVKYDSAFFALGQDLNNSFAKSIYYGSIENVGTSNNGVVCKTWAELYAYFLEKNGLDAYVEKKGKHMYVIAYDGTNKIKADATNQTNSFDDTSRLTDLVRCKIGARPAGFQVFSYEDLENDIAKDMKIVQSDYEDVDYSKFQNSEELNELMELIDDKRDLSSLTFGLEQKQDSVENIITKITYINDLMKKTRLDNMDSIGYLGHLFNSILNKDELKRASLCNSLYEHLYTDCRIIPMISIYKGKFGENGEKLDEDAYLFLTYDERQYQLKNVSKEKILDDISTHTIERIKKGDGYKKIEGIPEINMEPEELAEKFMKDMEREASNIVQQNKLKSKEDGSR